MSRPNKNEDWEGKKKYLIRSCSQDVPTLSLAPEEDELFDSTRSHIRSLPTEAPEALERPNSPLTPLIIETGPNCHDEPEEFYRELEKKISKVAHDDIVESRNAVKEAIEHDLEAGDENSDILKIKRVSDTIINIQSSSESEATQEIEMMRTPRIHPSIGSLHEASISAEIHHSSNSASVTNNNEKVIKKNTRESSRRRKRSTASSVSSKRIKYKDAVVQTSFDYEEGNGEALSTLNDIFVGTPRLFRLCSCVNHFCD